MGQRSQIYIRYKNKKSIVAMHLQWNYDYYMINRTYQLLDYIKKNVSSSYSNFKEKNFGIANYGTRKDIDILHNLIQINTTIGSYVAGYDLIDNEFKNEDKTTFKLTPKDEDNNNGILVIDIQETGKIKYGLAGGYEEIEDMSFDDDFKMINAKTYFELSEMNKYKEYKLENQDKELYEEVLKQIDFIDNNFELLTDKEYKEIFNTEYEYKNCIKEKEKENR